MAAAAIDRLPAELCARIFGLLDHPDLVAALQVCRRWREMGSDDELWRRLFRDRWGAGSVDEVSSPVVSGGAGSWKGAYEVQDRCDRIGRGLKIIREGRDYYVVHRGRIQRFLGSSSGPDETKGGDNSATGAASMRQEEGRTALSDKILFFIGDLAVACASAKRRRIATGPELN